MITYSAGQHYGYYVLVRKLDQGGFAEVWLGKHVYLSMHAAIKVLRPNIPCRDRQQFLHEARIAASLDHYHIVRVLEYGIKFGVQYLAMSYAPYGSLRRFHPAGKRLSVHTILTYLDPLAAALEYIHLKGLVHGDIKPENMLLGREYQLLLSDFGVAATTRNMGTLPYVAPECFEGNFSPLSDQYALAVVVYEWLSGRFPFNGSPEEIMRQHLRVQPPSLRTSFPEISPAIERVVLKALHKNPAHRFASIVDFVTAFREASYT
jgi:serine/threonine protein kinase